MSFWTAVVVIVGIWAVVAVLRGRQNSALGYATDEEGNPIVNTQRERELETELEQMRERLKVLERIATDENETTRLSSEIDKLRDE